MAQRTAKQNTDREPGGNVETLEPAPEFIPHAVVTGPLPPTIPDVVQSLEVMVARRLYEVWRTCGQLSDPKWDWTRQSTQAQHAWRCVARATLPRVQEEHFGPHEIAQVNHG